MYKVGNKIYYNGEAFTIYRIDDCESDNPLYRVDVDGYEGLTETISHKDIPGNIRLLK